MQPFFLYQALAYLAGSCCIGCAASLPFAWAAKLSDASQPASLPLAARLQAIDTLQHPLRVRLPTFDERTARISCNRWGNEHGLVGNMYQGHIGQSTHM